MAAQRTVLSSSELLELILLQLDMRTLLTSAQLVCHAWTNTITRSPSIQQALYLRPVPIDSSKTIEKAYNPLLAEVFPPFFPQYPTSSTRKQEEKQMIISTSTTSDGQVSPPFTLASLDLAKHPEKRTAYLRKEASWRRMLVQQPPALTLSYLSVSETRGGRSWARFKIPCGTGTGNDGNNDNNNNNNTIGLRMNMLYDLLLLLGPFSRVSSTSLVLWWGQVPSDIRTSGGLKLRHVFERASAESDILIYTRSVVQCVRNARWPESPEDKLSIKFPHEDWG